MASAYKWHLTDEDKDRFIDTLTEHLPALRAQAGVSQGDLSRLIGISRQTYSSIEGKLRRMSWDTYLALLLFFDYNRNTHALLRNLSAFPVELVERFNSGAQEQRFDPALLLGPGSGDILGCLDEQAMHAVRTLLLIEYARCAGLSGEAVLRTFSGTAFAPTELAKKSRKS